MAFSNNWKRAKLQARETPATRLRPEKKRYYRIVQVLFENTGTAKTCTTSLGHTYCLNLRRNTTGLTELCGLSVLPAHCQSSDSHMQVLLSRATALLQIARRGTMHAPCPLPAVFFMYTTNKSQQTNRSPRRDNLSTHP